jgi:hypothetical protein
LAPEAYKHISKLTALEDVNAVGLPIDDAGIAYLAKLPNLKHLRIPGDHDISGKGLQSLKSARKLEDLQADGTIFTVDDIVALKGLKLKRLFLPKHNYSVKDMARLKAAFPTTRLIVGTSTLDAETKAIFAPLH